MLGVYIYKSLLLLGMVDWGATMRFCFQFAVGFILGESGCLSWTSANYRPASREAQKEVQNIALDTNFSIPGDPGFPLNQVHSTPPLIRVYIL